MRKRSDWAAEKKAKREYNKKLGRYMRDMREKSGCSQVEVAKVAGYSSPQYISNIEGGVCAIPNHLLKVMIQQYSIDTEDFLEFLSEIKKNYYKKVFSKELRLRSS